MARYSHKNKVSDQTRDEATKIARGTQRPGQTKEQTRLIAQGIQKGIDQYKKQQKSKARELDKKLSKVTQQINEHDASSHRPESAPIESAGSHKLPWILLMLSWVCFALYLSLL